MSTMRFDVHVDKENAAPVHNIYRGKALNRLGPAPGKKITESNRGKPAQLVQRKALSDVINDPASRNARRKESAVNKDEFCSPLKCSLKSVCSKENVHGNVDNTKGDFQKTVLSLQNLKVQKDGGKQISPLTEQKPQEKPKPASKITDEDYDTDSIFSASERLSSYVNRLLTWRPPCLFGALPDSESDTSDLEQLPEDDILFDLQLPTATVPEFSDEDLVNLMNDLPPHSPRFGDPEQDGFCEDKDIELCLDQTMDTSLTFGSLHVMHGSLEICDSSSSTDLDLSVT